MKLLIGADHRGFELKNKVVELLKAQFTDWEIVDSGSSEYLASDDYTEIAVRVAKKVATEPDTLGVLLCGSGIGMAIVANKIAGIRASLVANPAEAKQERLEHNSNILVMASDKCPTPEHAVETIRNWANTKAEGGRHLRRVNHIRWIDLQETTPGIIPTILEADLTEATRQFELFSSYLPIVNFDIIDGSLFGGRTISLEECLPLVEKSPALISIHLMIKKPLALLEKLNNLPQVSIVYLHAEADLAGVLEREWSFRLGITFNSPTPVNIALTKKFPIVQLMTVEAGAQGREFQAEVLEKITELRNSGYEGEIHLDGGINLETLARTIPFKPDVLNVGSVLTKSTDPRGDYKKLVDLLD